MKNHSEIEKKLTDFLFGELSHEEEKIVRSHLASCEACAKNLKELTSVIGTLKKDLNVEASSVQPLSDLQRAAIFAAAADPEISDSEASIGSETESHIEDQDLLNSSKLNQPSPNWFQIHRREIFSAAAGLAISAVIWIVVFPQLKSSREVAMREEDASTLSSQNYAEKTVHPSDAPASEENKANKPKRRRYRLSEKKSEESQISEKVHVGNVETDSYRYKSQTRDQSKPKESLPASKSFREYRRDTLVNHDGKISKNKEPDSFYSGGKGKGIYKQDLEASTKKPNVAERENENLNSIGFQKIPSPINPPKRQAKRGIEKTAQLAFDDIAINRPDTDNEILEEQTRRVDEQRTGQYAQGRDGFKGLKEIQVFQEMAQFGATEGLSGQGAVIQETASDKLLSSLDSAYQIAGSESDRDDFIDSPTIHSQAGSFADPNLGGKSFQSIEELKKSKDKKENVRKFAAKVPSKDKVSDGRSVRSEEPLTVLVEGIGDREPEEKEGQIHTKNKINPIQLPPPVDTTVNPISTFSIDVDTASYTAARRDILNGNMPNPHSIRPEEFINYFDYKYKAPNYGTFSIITDFAPSPFQRNKHILRVAIQGKRPGSDTRRPSAFTFVIDTSGSMGEPNRLPLIQQQLPQILDQMRPADVITLVTTDLNSRLVLDQVPVAKKGEIVRSLQRIQAQGGTNLEEGLITAYNHAEKNYKGGAYNRVILFSDGVANLGEMDAEVIQKRVEKARNLGITFTAVGVGRGNYNDELLETLADKGDGNYLFVDSEEEAQRVFGENFSANFNVIAKDTKIQVEFNPKKVKNYRLIGYDNRRLRNEDFRDDAVDAGEVGAGQSVTALYEIEMNDGVSEKICEVRVRYKDPDTLMIQEFNRHCSADNEYSQFERADGAFRLATIVAEFAEFLKYGPAAKGISLESLQKETRPIAHEMGADPTITELTHLMMQMK